MLSDDFDRVTGGWREVTEPFRRSADGQALLRRLEHRAAAGAEIYPPCPLRALALTPLEAVQAVIVGQDPYHGPGQAEGLAFSVAPGVAFPPSLRNIFAELRRDLGLPPPASGSLAAWARHGVLLLNTTLTVERGRPASHARWGWERLTDALLAAVATRGQRIFMLWGAHAQAKARLLGGSGHLLLQSNHPSPLSARRGPSPFLGCGHFSAAARFAAGHGQCLDWSLTD